MVPLVRGDEDLVNDVPRAVARGDVGDLDIDVVDLDVCVGD
jgi:hypothetical protein